LRAKASDQYTCRLSDSLAHAFQEGFVDGHMAAVPGISLVMNVLMRVSAADHARSHLRRVKLKYFGLLVIDPDDCVLKVTHTVPVALIDCLCR